MTHAQIVACYSDSLLLAIANDWSVRVQWPERHNAIKDEIKRREKEEITIKTP